MVNGRMLLTLPNPDRLLLSAPLTNDPRPGDRSWTKSNPSAYLIDSGLWTACKESREVMKKHFLPWSQTLAMWYMELYYSGDELTEGSEDEEGKHEEDKHEEDGYSGGNHLVYVYELSEGERFEEEHFGFQQDEDGDLLIIPDTYSDGMFLGPPLHATLKNNGSPQQFTVHNRSDLFIFQPLDINNLRWPNELFNIFQAQESGLKHVALEFDPTLRIRDADVRSAAWRLGARKPFCQLIYKATRCRMIWVHRLWLIDYRIRRLLNAPRTSEPRRTFYSSTCRYVEVRRKDPGWITEFEGGEERPNQGTEEDLVTACDFADNMKEGMCPIHTSHMLGVLACENLD